MKRLTSLLAITIVIGLLGAGVVAANSTKFGTHLTGAEEVPPRDTNAQGQAKLTLSDDGLELICRLNVANIENVVAAHIHLGEAGENGPIVAFLYGPVAPGGGRLSGNISVASITEDDLVNDLLGATLADLIAEIEAGNAYVNVHTNDAIAPTNTGPGDFPGGEIRGQLD
jgi:hypothetical protein